MGKRHLSFIAIGLLLAAGTARAGDPHKADRDAKIKQLENEINKLAKLVKDADKKTLCKEDGGEDETASPPAGWSPPTPPLTDEQKQQQQQNARGRQRRDRRAALVAAAEGKNKGSKQKAGSSPAPTAGVLCRKPYAEAQKKIIELIEAIDKLNETTEGTPRDDKAGWIRSGWNQYYSDVGTRLGWLVQMRQIQYSSAHAHMKCKAISEAQVARAKAAHQHESLDEMEAARHDAEVDETTADNIVSKEHSRQSDLQGWHNSIMSFSYRADKKQFDGAWIPVVDALQHSSKKLLDQWNDEWVLGERECVEPSKGEDNAGVKAEEDGTFADAKAQLDADLKEWRKRANDQIYKYDCESMKKMHKLYCEQYDGDRDPKVRKEDLVQFDAEADKLKEGIREKLKEPAEQLEEMSTRALKLGARRNGRMGTVEAYRAWLKEMDAIRDQVRAERDQLDKVRYGGIFQGSRNPKRQLWMTYGEQRHDEMSAKDKKYGGEPCALADDEFCAKRETNPDGTAGDCISKVRPDCIVIPDQGQCRIFEFKPDSSYAKDAGFGQLLEYKQIVEKHYQTAL
ncbi:MAG TPA: hypothetical protein VL172_13625, partial [Kofleriaceae bacterium]|nr:hypothetical protein [Kofleriaceae bacterium]